MHIYYRLMTQQNDQTTVGKRSLTPPHSKRVSAAPGKPLSVAGKFTADVVCQGKEVEEAEFIVTEGIGKPLLGKKTAIQLNVLKIGAH